MYYQIFLLGFFTIVTQIVLLREIISTFSGNELSTGIMLFAWLLGSGLGNFFSKKYINKFKIEINHLFLINLLYFLLIIFLIRRLKTFLGFIPGEIVGVVPLLYFSVIFISSYCIIWGISFGSLYYLLKVKYFTKFSESKLYYIESIGAAVGSIITTFLLIRISSIFFIIALLLSLLGISFFIEKRKINLQFILSIFFAFILIFYQRNLNLITEKWRIGDFKIKNITESFYGKIVVIKTGNCYSFYNNGVFLFSTGDDISPQIDVSLALSEAPMIKKVLVIGGNYKIIKMLAENPLIDLICYIEFDPALINIQGSIIKNNYFTHPKVILLTGDARYYVRKIKTKFDLIISSLPDPVNLQINRFYSVEFFKLLKQKLSSDGVFYFKISSSENFISKSQGLYTGCVYKTLKKVFKDVIVLPGDQNYFLASNNKGIITIDQKLVEQRGYINNVKSDYFFKYFLKFNFDEFRINNLLNSINYSAKINTDLRPISYLYGIILWTTRFNEGIKRVFLKLYSMDFKLILVGVLIIFLILFFLIKTEDGSILLSIGSIGFTEISLEIFIILAYQIVRGYLYSNIGIIFFSFMAGLAIGSFIYQKIKIHITDMFYLIQFMFIFIPLVLYLWYNLIQLINIEFIQDIMFIISVFGFSILSGIQFPTAVKLFSDKRYGAGKVNGVDLVSSSLGAIIISLIIVPLFGLINLLLLLTVINLFAFLILSAKFKTLRLRYKVYTSL